VKHRDVVGGGASAPPLPLIFVHGRAVWHIQDNDTKMQCGLTIKPPLRTTTDKPKEVFLCHSCLGTFERSIVGKGRLTDKELAILTDLATTGASNEELAERHNISPTTVRTHMQNIQLRLGLHSKVEMVVYFWTRLYRRDDEPGRGN